MSKKKKALIVIALFLVVGISGFLLLAREGQKIIEQTPFHDIDLTQVKDGDYTGDFKAGPVYARVQVTATDGRVKAIDLLEHRNGMGSKGEAVIPAMLTEKTTKVDDISGATLSSKVIRKAVENALEKQ